MSVNLSINSVTFPFPQTGDEQWGDVVTNWATAATNGMLQKAGGLFTLTNEVDFGANFGLKSSYYKSRTANVAGSGQIRLANADSLSFRNSTNTGDLAFRPGSVDAIPQYNGIDLVNLSTAQTLTNKTLTSPVITNPTITGTATFVNLTASGNVTFGDADTDTVNFIADVVSNIRPDANNTYDLGSSANRWRDIYVSRDAYLGRALAGDGTASTPSMSFENAASAGMFRNGTNIGLSVGGTQRVEFKTSGITLVNSSVIDVPDGTSSVPSYTFSQDLDTGMYRINESQIGFTTSGTQRLIIDGQDGSVRAGTNTAFRATSDGSAASAMYSFLSDPDTGMYRIAANTLGFSSGASETMRMTSGAVQINNVGSTNQHVIYGRVEIQSQNASGIAGINVLNSATGSNAHSPILVAVQDTSAGDPYIRFRIPGGAEWVVGSDNSDSDRFKISNSTLPGTTDRLIIDSNGSILVNAGTNLNVGYGFIGEEDTGMYLVSSNVLGFSAGNQHTLRMSSTNVVPQVPLQIPDGSAATPFFSFVNDTDTGIYRSSGPNRMHFVLDGNPMMHFQSGNTVFQYGILVPDGAVGSPGIGFTGFTTTGLHAALNTLGIQVGGIAVINVHNDSIRTLKPITAENGTQANPAYSFENEENTGFYLVSANQIGISIGGNFRGRLRSDGFEWNQPIYLQNGSPSGVSYTFSDSTNTGMYREADGTLAFAKSGARKVGMDDNNIFIDVQTRGPDGLASNPTYSWDNDPDTGIYRGGSGIIIFASNANDAGSVDSTRKWTFGQTGDAVIHRINGSYEVASDASNSYVQDPLKSATLLNNTTGTILTLPFVNYNSVVVEYSIRRGLTRETGMLFITHDGSTADVAPFGAGIGTNGIDFTADISGADLRLRYTASNTGTNATMKYSLRRWNIS